MASAQGLKGKTQQDAVFQALDELGDRTSIQVLQERATKIYGRKISNISAHKTWWRMKKGIDRDNRTYAGQPRRNMLNDKFVPKAVQRRVDENLDGRMKRAILLVLKHFHSKEQLRTALRS